MARLPPPSLLGAISTQRPSRGRPYSAGIRGAVVEFGQRRRADGATWKQIASELGMPFDTVRRWCLDAPAMRRVVVVADESPRGNVAVASPAGHRIEGLTLEQAIAVLRALG